MKLNVQMLKCAKALFNNPFKNGIRDRKAQSAILLPICYSGVQAGLALMDVEDHKIEATDKILNGFVGLGAAAGGIFGIGGAIVAGTACYMLKEANKDYFVA